MFRPSLTVLSLLCLLLIPVRAGNAQSADDQPGGTLSFTLENDVFFGRDRNYTNGARLEYATAPGGAPEWLRDLIEWDTLFPEGADFMASFAIGQNMYTPDDIEVVPAPADQRPYAGWLYGEATLTAVRRDRLDAVKVSLGIIGPASLAEQTQKLVHRIIDSPKPLGWDDQLKTEPALLVSWHRQWRTFERDLGLVRMDLIPHVGVNLGNVFTHASAGGSLRLGWNLPADYGVPRIQPSVPGSSYQPIQKVGFYAFAGGELRAVARNIFLDGNSFRSGPSVSKKPLVADLQLGVAVVWPGARLAFTRVYRTDEFDGQEDNDVFGAVSLSLSF